MRALQKQRRPSSSRTFVIGVVQNAPWIAAPRHDVIRKSPALLLDRHSREDKGGPSPKHLGEGPIEVVFSIELNCKQGYQSYEYMPGPPPIRLILWCIMRSASNHRWVVGKSKRETHIPKSPTGDVHAEPEQEMQAG